MRKETTKVCVCGNTHLVLLPSLNRKYCADCHTEIPWYLAEGQKSPTTSHIGGLTETGFSDTLHKPPIETENIPAEKIMQTQTEPTIYIPLMGTDENQLVNFLKAVEALHKCTFPKPVIQLIIETAKDCDEDTYLVVSTTGMQMISAKLPENANIVGISEAFKLFTEIHKLMEFVKVLDKVTPNTQQTETSSVKSNTHAVGKKPVVLTVREAAEEFRDMWELISATLAKIGFVFPGESRLEHVRIAMVALEDLVTEATNKCTKH